jgi:hypothetical protein
LGIGAVGGSFEVKVGGKRDEEDVGNGNGGGGSSLSGTSASLVFLHVCSHRESFKAKRTIPDVESTHTSSPS